MVERGARNIVLASRSGPKKASGERLLEALEKAGCTVIDRRADVTKEKDVKDLLKKPSGDSKTKLPPIKGIFHLAAVLSDGYISTVDNKSIDKVMGPKANAALLMSEVVDDLKLDLDFFILSSSISGVVGNLEQCAYSAANATLDAIAMNRRARGERCFSFQLGALRGAGLLEENEVAAQIVKQRGFNSLHISEILKALNHLFVSGLMKEHEVMCIAYMDWAKQCEITTDQCKFTHLVTGLKEKRNDGSLSSPDDVKNAILEYLGKILCVDPESIKTSQSMVMYGVDSLMSMSLVDWASDMFGLKISHMDILNGLTTQDLIEKSVCAVFGEDAVVGGDDGGNKRKAEGDSGDAPPAKKAKH